LKKKKSDKKLKVRYEKFGAIFASEDPPALVFADKKLTKTINGNTSPLWDKKDDGILTAPIEAHYAITNYCDAQCPGCYMGSGLFKQTESDEELFENAKKIAGYLKEMNIFHVALGGGESFLMPWFIDLAHYFRDMGIVPNVTTNGYLIDDETAKKCTVFGQVNVSLDGIGEKYNLTRSKNKFTSADFALKTLQKNKIRSGINCVISQKNFDDLEEIISYAKDVGAVDIEFLRFKPTGRGKEIYHEMALTPKQGIKLFPKLKKLSRKYKIGLKLDCSFTPFICYHKPSKKQLEYFSIMGCDAGNWLIGVSPEGVASPCSFIEDNDIPVEELAKSWSNSETFKIFRYWEKDKTKCSSCKYLSICKGGCHAVSYFLTGSFLEPDPECPILLKKKQLDKKL